MNENPRFRSLLAATCYVVEHQVSVAAAMTLSERHYADAPADDACDNNMVGGLLREAGIPSTSMDVSPSSMGGIIERALMEFRAVLVEFLHPLAGYQHRWLVAYGMGRGDLFTVVALPPTEPDMRPSDLWPNVTGQMVVLDASSPSGLKVELLEISMDLEGLEG